MSGPNLVQFVEMFQNFGSIYLKQTRHCKASPSQQKLWRSPTCIFRVCPEITCKKGFWIEAGRCYRLTWAACRILQWPFFCINLGTFGRSVFRGYGCDVRLKYSLKRTQWQPRYLFIYAYWFEFPYEMHLNSPGFRSWSI